jgi:hypothetical protein
MEAKSGDVAVPGFAHSAQSPIVAARRFGMSAVCVNQNQFDLLHELSAMPIDWTVVEDANSSSVTILLQTIEKHMGRRGGDQSLLSYLNSIMDTLWSLDHSMAHLYGHRIIDHLTDLENRQNYIMRQQAVHHAAGPIQG